MAGTPVKWPVYIVSEEPRVRRRMWPEERRARRAASEAAQGQAVGEFIVALGPPHPSNKHPRPRHLYLAGQINGVITSLITIAATCSR